MIRLLFAAATFSLLNLHAADFPLAPRLVGDWWKIAGDPDQLSHLFLFRTQTYGKNAKTMIYHSRNPLNFGINDDAGHYVTTLPVAAPEIIQHESQWYMAALLPSLMGIQITKMEWASAK